MTFPAAQKTRSYLPYLPFFIPKAGDPAALAKELLDRCELRLPPVKVEVKGDGEDYTISCRNESYTIRGGKAGVLYGAYHFMRQAHLAGELTCEENRPFYPLRMIDHWDNMTGDIERGYAGHSLFFKDKQIVFDEQIIHRYGLMMSAAAINCVCLNNVNVHFPADRLITEEFLPQLKQIADILRIYHIRLLISVDFSMPERYGAGTADPLDEGVQAWWKKQTAVVYSYIPDLAGYLVKADSEHRSGPYTYGRDHAEGANMLARALAPFGGKVLWRCFVYNCGQDWRDTTIDRACAAWDNYCALDGKFDSNVILQIKNGPMDFQVREPVSPLLFGMKNTAKCLELQLAQEYTGQQVDLFFMPPQWQDIFDVLPAGNVEAIVAVSNTGDDINWFGHDLAAANLYGYGHLGWYGRPDAEQVAGEFAGILFGFKAASVVREMLLMSRDVYEGYTCPFALGWMITPHVHYGVSPDGYEFDLWGTYHKANHEAVGVERGPSGTGYSTQYPAELAEKYATIESCPEELLLFFHRVRYDHVMKDGRTLLQRIYDNHFNGYEGAKKLQQMWLSLEGETETALFARVRDRFERQVHNAREWCDVINTYFYRFTGIGDEKGRTIYE